MVKQKCTPALGWQHSRYLFHGLATGSIGPQVPHQFGGTPLSVAEDP
jgi:hypothetical protein